MIFEDGYASKAPCPVSEPVRVVFLDFDGVLNGAQTETLVRVDPRKAAAELDPVNVAHVKPVLERPDVRVVLATSWLDHYPVEDLCRFLERVGVRPSVLGRTPSYVPGIDKLSRPSTRAQRIARWLWCWDQSGYVPLAGVAVLDDDRTVDAFGAHAVRTRGDVGAQARDAARLTQALALPCDVRRLGRVR